MTWEWAFVLSVAIVCVTIAGLYKYPKPNNSEIESINSRVDSMIKLVDLRFSDLEKSHESITKTAEETKKLLSQANLAVGLGRRG